MNIRTAIIALLSAFIFIPSAFAKDYNIMSYGAKKSTRRLNTKAIQQAIDDCHKNRGGRVIIPKGKFLTGAIVLKSDVTLHLEEGAVLLGSKNPADYVITERKAGVMISSQLILAGHANNIGITGKGSIDGQGMIHRPSLQRPGYHATDAHPIRYLQGGDNQWRDHAQRSRVDATLL